MSYRQTVLPTVEERPRTGGGLEREISHPSFATVRVSRVSGTANLFDSNIAHDGFITLTFCSAKKVEDGYSERVYGGAKTLFQVAMSENQFVAMVTRMNHSSGVPCTIQHMQSGPTEVVPAIGVFENSAQRLERMAKEIDEGVRRQQAERIATLKGVLSGLSQKKQAEVDSLLDLILNQSMTNLDYGRDVLVEHAEKLVTEAKVEIDAHVTGIVTQLGVDSLHHLTQIAASVRVDDSKLLGSDLTPDS